MSLRFAAARAGWLALALGAGAFAGPAFAQDVTLSADEVAALRAELSALKAEAADRARRIDLLEHKLDTVLGPASSSAAAAPPQPPVETAHAAPPAGREPVAA
ncbi:hypothetical protein, partial [Caulobacter sp. 17J80-11]|uniref:hypothetical protein n=1 Tax=Caulobacter sp. 17J80-11 TaxID=2763502 RepID=UPI001994B44C|nr:hypothetical protein [Caulobacter sp. 17J80-11]